jgi:hypothetical protein
VTGRALDLLRLLPFLAFLACPLAVAALGVEPAGVFAHENRPLATVPDICLLFSNPQAYAKGLRTAFADRFPLREPLIRAGNRLRLAVFGESPVPGVILGRDGWLFYSLEHALDDHVNVMDMSEAFQADMVRILTERRDRLAARGIAFYVVVAPDKHTVYPEYLPGYVHPLRPRSRLDILGERLTAAGVSFVDLRPDMARAKAVRRAYWKTDTHWNDWGAFSGAARLVEVLRQRFPAIPELRAEDYLVTEADIPGGDLAGMLLLPDILRETDIRLVPRDPGAPGMAAVFGAARPYADPANHPDRAMVVAETGNTELPRALFFRDSFSSAMIPFLAGRFQSAVFLWDHAYHPDIVAAEKPDVVILEVVERYQYAFSLDNPPEPEGR